jgi:hypothetical protein
MTNVLPDISNDAGPVRFTIKPPVMIVLALLWSALLDRTTILQFWLRMANISPGLIMSAAQRTYRTAYKYCLGTWLDPVIPLKQH